MYSKVNQNQNQRWMDWFAVICLALLLIIATTRLTLTKWVSHLELAGWLTFLGAISGYLLGRTHIHWIWSLLLSVFVTVIAIPLAFMLGLSEQQGLTARAVEIWERMSRAAGELLSNQPVSDSILFLIAMGALFWIIGLSSGFTLVRNAKPWFPLIIMGISLLIIESYQPSERRSIYSWLYVTVLFILLGRLFFLKLKKSLAENNNQVGAEAEYEFMRGVILLALIFGLAGWTLPGVINKFQPDSSGETLMTVRWQQFSKNFENIFYALDQQASTVEESIAEDLSLGTGQILGEEEVLYIQVDPIGNLRVPLYWRGKVYDVYRDGRWMMGSAYTEHFKPSEPIHDNLLVDGQIPVKVRVTSQLDNLTQLYITGEPKLFNRAVDGAVAVQTIEDQELLAFYLTPDLGKGETYRFETIVSSPSAYQLSESGTKYPVYVMERYLQLPMDLPKRVKDLSIELTKGKETAFDKAAAITLYLRQNIQYQQTIAPPPRNQDPIDWFLFDYKKGFCNYYATAEVLLLRAAGVPARLAVGYSQGIANDARTSYSVHREDSHAWPEVYFPNYGWVAFEPTGAMSAVDYSSANRNIVSSDSQSNLEITPDIPNREGFYNGEERANRYLEEVGATELDQNEVKPKISIVGWIILSLLIAALVFWIVSLIIQYKRNRAGVIRRWQAAINDLKRFGYSIPLLGYWFRSFELRGAERYFLRVEFAAELLGEKGIKGQTAKELADKVIEQLPDCKQEVCEILESYQDQQYGITLEKPQKRNKFNGRRVILAVCQFKWQKVEARIERFNQRFTHS